MKDGKMGTDKDYNGTNQRKWQVRPGRLKEDALDPILYQPEQDGYEDRWT